MRHGLHSSKLPKNAEYIEVQRNVFRRAIEDALIAARGRHPTMTEAGFILAATKAFEHFKKADRYEHEATKVETKLFCSSEAKKAAADIAKAIAALDLDRDTQDAVMDSLYSRKPRLLPAPKRTAQ